MNSHILKNPYISSDTDPEKQNQWLLWLVAVLLGILYAPTCLWLWDRWTMSVWQNGHGILVTVARSLSGMGRATKAEIFATKFKSLGICRPDSRLAYSHAGHRYSFPASFRNSIVFIATWSCFIIFGD